VGDGHPRIHGTDLHMAGAGSPRRSLALRGRGVVAPSGAVVAKDGFVRLTSFG